MSDYYADQFDNLVGKQILSVEWSEENLRFNMKGDAVCFAAIGDCCSRSYIESLDNPEIFKDAEFLSVEVVEGQEVALDNMDVHRWTFYKFKTSKGMCTLSFRNESNGYYNGCLELCETWDIKP